MKVFTIILFCGLVVSGSVGSIRGQGTSDSPAGPVAANAGTNSSEIVLPQIDFNDVPMTTAISVLARQAGINYQIDLRCAAELNGAASPGIPAPVINLHLKNVKVRETLSRILDLNGFALVDDPVTTVAWITKKGLPARTLNYDLLTAGKEPSAAGEDNTLIPLIQFSDVPLDAVLGNLATQAGKNLMVSHAINGADYETLSVRWENITAKQAILAVCENYDFSFMTNNTPGVVMIVPLPKPK